MSADRQRGMSGRIAGTVRTVRWVLGRVVEVMASLTLVVVFFLVFLGILGLSFPKGTGLRELVGYRDASIGGDMRLQLDLGDSGVEFVAKLTDVWHRVKSKPAGTIVWSDAQAGAELADRHAVQTFDRSGATIFFDRDNQLHLNENSLLVVRHNERETTRNKGVRLVMLGGEVTGRLSGPVQDAVEIGAGAGTAKFQGGANFRVNVDQRSQATISVYSGSAEVDAAGRRVRVGAQHAVQIDADGRLSRIIALPGRPQPVSPGDGSVHTFRATPPRVRFAWDSGKAEEYRVRIARDRSMRDLVLDRRVADPELAHGNLEPGRYFWTVSGMRSGAEGVATKVRELEVLHDVEPPPLDVRFPDLAAGAAASIEGRTEPGALVLIGEEEIAVGPDGSFIHPLALDRGVNVVVVQAYDRAGNVSHRSAVLSSKPR